jgi:hypothetical protein
MSNTNFDLKNSFFDEDSVDDLDDGGNEIDDGKKDESDDVILVSKSKMVLVKKLINNIKENNDNLLNILSSLISSEDEARISIGQSSDDSFSGDGENDGSLRVVEGVFDGENMIGPDGKVYSVPANYASKSKLVEGDIMKLTISAKGTFVYKQIGPIDRLRVVGQLEKAADGNFYVLSESNKWRVLTASVTYFKGAPGDEVVILIPKSGESRWAAIENVVHNPEK